MRRHLAALELDREPLHLLVALSGGCDSVTLLYLLRFPLSRAGVHLEAAHVDHAMRPGSAADAAWVRGLCTAWEVPLHETRLATAPTSEAAARDARYHFLRECAAAREALIVTAHHADDQAETVLFRAVRGTGLRGLGGIRPRANGVVRPLLQIWREEIAAYARARGIAWRSDETNAIPGPARNRIRHHVLPLIEGDVAPAARRSLVSLAGLAREAEGALERIARAAARDLVVWDEGVPAVARDRLHLYDPAIRARVLRRLLRRFDVVLDRAGTRRALQFITDARSGRQMPLSRSLRIEIEFDRARFVDSSDRPEADVEWTIGGAEERREGRFRLGGVDYRVRHGPGIDPGEGAWTFRGAITGIAFPLRLRGRLPGDRVRDGDRTRSLKKLLLERRVPRARRARLPLLVDAKGEVIWVAGLDPPAPSSIPATGEEFVVKVLHD